ncbi:MAG: phage terminase large subunit family protein [Pseudomonadota bacterium]
MELLNKIPNKQKLQQMLEIARLNLKPPPKLTVSQWADSERRLSAESSAEPGEWSTDRAPFQRDIMDCFTDKSIHTIVVKASSQVGKTEILNNIVGYTIDQDPAPMLIVQPTLDMGKAWSKDRLAPMVRDTSTLTDKVSANKRDGENSIFHKKFTGGHLTVSGANSPASLASRPIRIVLLDEVDRYDKSAGVEGDPANLAIKRTTTFWNRKIVYVSTPTIKNDSRIDAAYQASDQRVYQVPCPHCGEYQELSFWQLQRPYANAPPDKWDYVCKENGCIIEEHHKPWMLANGKWHANKPTNGIAGFWIHEIYSPWVSWQAMIENFLEMKKLPDTYKTFINTSLAELWDEEQVGEGLTADAIHARTEIYQADVPAGVFVMTAAIDVQDDRFEIEFLGWGLNRESWSIDYVVKHGDPGIASIWEELDHIIERKFQHELGVEMKATCVCIDAGGHHTESVYKYVKKKAAQKKRVYAIRGHSVRNQPILAKVSRNNDYRVKVFYLGTDTAKEMIYSQLKLENPGPGYMHHPEHYDAEYFNQLTSERKKTVYEKGRTITKWYKPPSKRNEALDLKVYNFAAFWILKADMNKVRENFLLKVKRYQARKELDIEKKTTSKDETKESVVKNQAIIKKPVRTKPRKTKKKQNYVKGWQKV